MLIFFFSENLAAISLRKALNLVNPVPFWKAVDEAGGMAAANAKLLASTGNQGHVSIMI